MEALLIESWLEGGHPIPVVDEASVSLVREKVRSEAERLGLPTDAGASLALVASELGHNQMAHARGGNILVRPVARDGVPGLELVAADRGDGIADPTSALRGRAATVGSLGTGLAAVHEMADELEFDIRRGEGTCIRARKFARRVRRRREVAILAHPHPDENASGDDARFLRSESALTIAVADGLGHGPEARRAAATAMGCVERAPERSLDDLLHDCHAALGETRGAVMTLLRVDESTGELSCCGVGNVQAMVCGQGLTRRFVGVSSVLGVRGPTRRLLVERIPVDRFGVAVLFTDGISTRAQLEEQPSLLVEHPVVIAHWLLETFGRGHDDMLVAVAR